MALGSFHIYTGASVIFDRKSSVGCSTVPPRCWTPLWVSGVHRGTNTLQLVFRCSASMTGQMNRIHSFKHRCEMWLYFIYYNPPSSWLFFRTSSWCENVMILCERSLDGHTLVIAEGCRSQLICESYFGWQLYNLKTYQSMPWSVACAVFLLMGYTSTWHEWLSKD